MTGGFWGGAGASVAAAVPPQQKPTLYDKDRVIPSEVYPRAAPVPLRLRSGYGLQGVIHIARLRRDAVFLSLNYPFSTFQGVRISIHPTKILQK